MALSAHLRELGMTEAAFRKAVKTACRTSKWPEYMRECMEDAECLGELLVREGEECPSSGKDYPRTMPFNAGRARRIRHRLDKSVSHDIIREAARFGDDSALSVVQKSARKNAFIGTSSHDPWDLDYYLTTESPQSIEAAVLYIALSFDWGSDEANQHIYEVYDDWRHGRIVYDPVSMPSSNQDLSGNIRDWLSGIMDFSLMYLYANIEHLLKHDPQRPSREQIKQAAFYLVRDNYVDFLVGEKTIKDLDKAARSAPGRF